MGLFAQVPPPGVMAKVDWLRRTAVARVVFDQSIRRVVGSRKDVASVRNYAASRKGVNSVEEIREFLNGFDEVSAAQRACETVANMMLYRELYRCEYFGLEDRKEALHHRISLYPERTRLDGRMLHVITSGIIGGKLTPDEGQFAAAQLNSCTCIIPPNCYNLIYGHIASLTKQPAHKA